MSDYTDAEPLTAEEREAAAAYVGREVGRTVRKLRTEATMLMAVPWFGKRRPDRVTQGRLKLAKADAWERLLFDPRGAEILGSNWLDSPTEEKV